MSAATIANITINQKSSFEITVIVKDDGVIKNLTGFTAVSKYKDNLQSPDNLSKPFITEVTDPTAGEITMSLTPEQTATMNLHKYVYDLAIISPGTAFKTRILEGVITVSGGVS